MGTPYFSLCPWDSPGKNTGVGCHPSPYRSLEKNKDSSNRKIQSFDKGANAVGWKKGNIHTSGAGTLDVSMQIGIWTEILHFSQS